MAQKQTIIWTMLPNGFAENGRLRASVFISPRLESDASYPTLDDFGNLRNWPKTVGGLGFTAMINGVAADTTVVGESPSAQLWDQLFPPSTFVRPFQVEDHSHRFIHSYPAAKVLESIRATYGELAASTGTSRPKVRGSNIHPAIVNLLDTLKRPADPKGHEKEYDAVVKNKTGPNGKPMRYVQNGNPTQYGFSPGNKGVTELAFMQVNRFYSRPENADTYYRTPADAHAQGVTPPPRPKLPEVDFHQMIAAFGDYGKMLRRVGLVIDLEIAPPSGMSTTGAISLSAPWTGGSSPEPYHKDVLPATQYEMKNGRFIPRPKNPNGDYAEGMLRIGGKGLFTIEQIDPDSASLKTLQFANNFNRAQKVAPSNRKYLKYKSYADPEEEGTPTLRTGGILLLRNERAASLAVRLAEQSPSAPQAVNNPANVAPTLWAEDVIRGIRPDMYDNVSKAWRSLCMRIEHLRLPNAGVEFDDEEEGYVRNTAVSSAHDGSSDDVYLHESLAEWEGWSLVAKRPGKVVEQIKYDDGGKALERPIIRPTTNESKPVPGFDFAEEVQVRPGTLPRLRFGREYRMRARLTDMAGNSLALKEADEIHASDPILFFRYEPVSSPVVVPNEVFREGESLEHLVIRSNYNVNAAAYGAQAYVVDAIKHIDERFKELNGGIGYAYKGSNERHILPPKTSQLMAELHGEFDKALGSSGNTSTFFNIAAKEEGRISDTQVHNTVGGMIDVSANVHIITTPDAKRGSTMKALPLAPGESLGSGQYLIYTGNVVLPWLPDSIARGVAFRNLPGATSEGSIGDGVSIKKIPGTGEYVTLVDFKMSWPVSGPFILRIEEGVAKPQWSGDVLTVFLPKATKARVQYSCYIGNGDVPLMGVLDMIATDASRTAAGAKAKLGAHWMLTPWRELALTHAVQQPLTEPFFYKPQIRKPGIGATYADLARSVIQLNTRSTGKLDLMAEWTEWVDDLTRPGPEQVKRSTYVLESKVEEWLDTTTNQSQEHQEMVPLRHKEEDVDKDWFHEFGDTHYREVTYRLKGTTRHREYLPISLWRDPVNLPQNDGETDPEALKKRIYRVGPPTTMKVPNSARPDAPSILYVVPTFGWEETREGNTVISRRCGNAVRVYLDRPWYSSGDGELLGVVMQQGGGGRYTASRSLDKAVIEKKIIVPLGEDKEKLKPYVTEWGMDPIWKSAYPKSAPAPGDFSLAEKIGGNLSLAELGPGGPLVFVAGHVVEYDPVRRLWFCDIEMRAGESYYPFVRLALARYQPESIPNAHLSRVVLCDFAQIAPDRVAAATYTAANNKLKIMVSGVYGTNTYTEYPPFSMTGIDKNDIVDRLALSRVVRVTIEEADGTTEDELSWEPISDTLTNIQLELVKKEDNTVVWMTNVTLPEKPLGHGGTKPMRMNIREYEVFEADPEVYIPPIEIPEEVDPFVTPLEMKGRPSDVIHEMLSVPGVVTTPGVDMEAPEGMGEGMKTMSYTMPGQLLTRLVERIVYADTIEI